MLLFGSSRNLLSSSLLCSADMCGGAASEEEVSQKKEAPYRFGGVFLRGFCTRVLHTGRVSGRTPAYPSRKGVVGTIPCERAVHHLIETFRANPFKYLAVAKTTSR